MAERVYSVPFIYYTNVTPNVDFEIPEGVTAVIRDIDVYTELGASSAIVAIGNPAAGVYLNFASISLIGAGVTGSWRGRVIATAPYHVLLDVASLDTNGCIYVGGYLLQGVYS